METSRFFNLNWGDFGRGVIVAVLTGFALPVLAVLQTPEFSFATANWNAILTIAINGGLAAFAGYITKNLFTAENGKFMGKV
jgi:hypothetical protein